jgi:acetylornithine/succinyldiaminopimelate/putrescine aminotransferase/predicted amino acid dehydrogenase
MHTQAQKALQVSPRFLAIEEGFHGKSTGSLKLTHREEFRRPWTHIGISVTFVARENIQALQATVESERVSYPALFFAGDGSVGIGLREVNTIAACFCEPIQGEGGIHKLSPAFLTALRTTATDEDFPLIFDEIQCGMGRCGTFLASEASGVRGDYYLLSKSLGGGLVKLAALVVDSAHYEYDFSYLHTSTFADDDLSSCVALRALELVEEDERSLVRECGRKGEWLRDRLRQLQESYPGQIRDVRGQGLMIGVELKPQHSSSSPLLRVLSEQNLLCYLAAGYLLRVHGIRIAPTLAHRTVLRIEPSAYISPGSLETFCLALERFLLLLRSADVARLLAFVIEGSIDDAVGTSLPEVTIEPGRSQIRLTENRKRVGFLVNFTGPRDLQAWEPALLRFRESDCEAFLDRTHGLLDPFILDETEIRSSRNDCVDVVLIGVPFTPTQAIAGMRQGDDQCASMVRKAVLMARERGCSVVGLGGHTSIVTDSGRSLIEDRINLTTGNSLTVAAAVEALLEVAHRRGLRPRSCHLGVVGAAGNVGATLAELLAEQVGSLVLVGRACSSRFLSPVAYRIYENAYEALRLGSPSGSIASAIERLPSIQALLKKNESCSGQFIAEEMIRDRGDATPVRIAESMAALQECQLIITATNAPSPVLKPQHVGDHDVVICDVAIPQDVSPTMEIEKPRAVVIRGGILRAPLGQRLDIPALRLPGSELYGCLAETIVLGFAEYNGHYSYGRISAERVRQVKGWALAHGFEVSGS